MHGCDDLAGIGLYTTSEASRLLKLRTATVRRWIAGYTYIQRGERAHAEPLWTLQLPKLDDKLGLGFLDLMQLRIVARFVAEGLSLQALRAALAPTEFFGQDHPFTAARFKTDGRRIFLAIVDQSGEQKVYDLARQQYGFHDVIAPSFRDVDFDAEVMTRWWPMGHQRSVVLDPGRSFGAPIAAVSGIPTATLADIAAREGSTRAVARWFPVKEREVRHAIEFERGLDGSAPRKLAA
jgi:hypothetical protein